MVEVYKHLHVYDKSSTCQKFVLRERPKRRHDYELQRNFANDGVREYQTNSLFYRSIDIWNGLGADVVTATSVAHFKEKLLTEWKKYPHKSGRNRLGFSACPQSHPSYFLS
eukprot:TCONS_00058183-protein